MTDILVNAANIAGRLKDMQLADTLSMIVFGLVLVFGLMNCILGYRLLRFWMMLFGFLIGAGIGAFGASQMGITDKTIYIVAMVAAGVILAVIAFAIFKAGIFLIGAGLGLSVTIYVIHPTTSFTFFICLLAGVGLGILAMRFEREVIIVGTSLLGGILSGLATAKLANMEEIPFGIIFSVGYALIGLLIQFAINKPGDEDYDDDEDNEEDEFSKSSMKREKAPFSGKRKSQDWEDDQYEDDLYEDDLYQEDSEDLDLPEDEDDLDEYAVDEDEVIEEYLEDYYGENKKKNQKGKTAKTNKPVKPKKTVKNNPKKSASPYSSKRG